MSSLEFVKLVARVFQSRGFQTEIPVDDEYGVDLVVAAEGGLEKGSNNLYNSDGQPNRMIVRCEPGPGLVGPTPIAVIYAARAMYFADTAAVVTAGTFTPPVFELARKLKYVRIISHHRLRRMYDLSVKEIPLPLWRQLPSNQTRCGLCFGPYGADEYWNDGGVERMCAYCAESVQEREATVIKARVDTECAYCGVSISKGERICIDRQRSAPKSVLYCMSGRCKAKHLQLSEQLAGKAPGKPGLPGA